MQIGPAVSQAIGNFRELHGNCRSAVSVTIGRFLIYGRLAPVVFVIYFIYIAFFFVYVFFFSSASLIQVCVAEQNTFQTRE